MAIEKAKIEVTMIRGAEKKHSVVYLASTESGQQVSFYIPKDWLRQIGNPANVQLTLEGD